MALNKVELALKEIYDGWQFGNEKENNGYSTMFRMGFPDEYIDSDRPLLMYVGQEDLNGNSYKTQEWVRKYQIVQYTQCHLKNFDERINYTPFWDIYRNFYDLGYNCLWNNLDKFLRADHKTHLSGEEAIDFNAPYGEERISILQREIALLKPKAIILAIGPSWKYIESLASAFSVDPSLLYQYRPTRKNYANDISAILGFKNTIVLWTYHPKYLRCGKLEVMALDKMKQIIEI